MNSRNLGDRVGERFEEIKLEGSQLVDKVKELAKEGKTRRVTIIKDGRTLADFPLYLGLGGSASSGCAYANPRCGWGDSRTRDR